ncbi:tumor necrosis factor receptor superfamily member 14 [Misgurnus anguillicaudatus]|uniref:tumor necrosis factor receptor superfamily member 14 n=1 Tax=Misgurnus anguillicaudatus TaxID=75329 RepID=UPI003CCF0703
MLVNREVLTAHITVMAHRQENHFRRPLTYFFLLLIIEVAAGQRSVNNKGDCSQNEYWSGDGFCCDKCNPGYRLIKKCSSGVKSTCKICMEGTYQDKMNYFSNCFRCQKCVKPSRPRAKEISSCTSTSNTVCGCEPGYILRKLDIVTWDCVPKKSRGLSKEYK